MALESEINSIEFFRDMKIEKYWPTIILNATPTMFQSSRKAQRQSHQCVMRR